MAYSYPVKWIINTMRGAPVISGTPGALIAAMDAFLLTGWGTATAISVSVSNGVGTATFAEGTFFEDYAVVLIAGVTAPAALNGEARVLSHTNNSITFETNAPDGVATTGTSITVKYAPVGSWVKAFAGTNLAVYKSTDIQSPGHCLRVDDTGTTSSRVVGYESMTDVNTGIGAFPTSAMYAGGGYLHKSALANATQVSYALAADSRALLTAIEYPSASSAAYRVSALRGFGDPIALAPGGDPWSTFLSAAASSNFNYLEFAALSGGGGTTTYGFTVAPRPLAGIGSALQLTPIPFTGTAGSVSGADTCLGAAPSAVDGQVKLSRMFLRETATGAPPRAVIPGVLYVPQSGMAGLVTTGNIQNGAGEWAGRKLLAFGTGVSQGAPTGAGFIDITGPWRTN